MSTGSTGTVGGESLPLGLTGLLAKRETTEDVDSCKGDNRCYRSLTKQREGIPHIRQQPHPVLLVKCEAVSVTNYGLVYNWIDHPLKRQQGLVLPSKTFTKKIIHLYLGSIIPEIRLFCWGTPILSFLRDEDPTRKEWHMMNLQCICDN